MLRRFGKFAAVWLVAWGSASLAHAAGGWYHMPTSFCQCMGWGFGPGYHAPLVLGPHRCGPLMPQHVVRLPCAPHGVGVGCEGCDMCAMGQLPAYPFPTMGEELPVPQPEPTPAEPPVAIEQPISSVTPLQRPLFGPPGVSVLGH